MLEMDQKKKSERTIFGSGLFWPDHNIKCLSHVLKALHLPPPPPPPRATGFQSERGPCEHSLHDPLASSSGLRYTQGVYHNTTREMLRSAWSGFPNQTAKSSRMKAISPRLCTVHLFPRFSFPQTLIDHLMLVLWGWIRHWPSLKDVTGRRTEKTDVRSIMIQ